MANMFDEGARRALAESLLNPAMVAMMGPVYGLENYTAGAMYSNAMMLWIFITVGIMNILLIVRHTRADEEKGRAEVVRSLPAGRMSILGAAMITAVIVNALMSLLFGFGIFLTGVESMGFAASMLSGLMVFLAGMVFAAVTALFSQLSASSAGAMGLSFLALGVFYILRAAGDLNSELLACISPLGLAQRSQFFVENHKSREHRRREAHAFDVHQK
jgi:ABC-2 type transport system permease protein